MKIILVGGGSGGSVSPLLAVANKIQESHPNTKFLFLGTKNGPEKIMAKSAKIAFRPVFAGKLKRYFSFSNFSSPIFILIGFFQSLKILKDFKADCVFGAGSFVQVPVIFAARFLKIPVIIHQQDVMPSLANKLCELAAKKITVTFETSITNFSSNAGFFYKKSTDKIILTGNPFRESLKLGSKVRALKTFNFKGHLPTLLVLGGGTGAEFINNLITLALSELSKIVQIIHSTGFGKQLNTVSENYFSAEFIGGTNLADAYALADIVLSRAGLSVLTELSNLKKASIIIPIPNSHQEINTAYLVNKQAGIALRQATVNPKNFTKLIRKLLFNYDVQELLKHNIGRLMPTGADKKIADIIIKEAKNFHAN